MQNLKNYILFVLSLSILLACEPDPCSPEGIAAAIDRGEITGLELCIDSLRSNSNLRASLFESMVDNNSRDVVTFARNNQIDPWTRVDEDQPLLSYIRRNNLDCLAYQIEILQYEVWSAQKERYAVENLILALHQGNSTVVEAFLRAGFPVDREVGNGVTPIVLTAMQGNYQSVRLLLKYNADPNSKYDGEPVLNLASRSGSAETVKILLDAGAKINETNTSGQSALMVAAKTGHKSVVKLLQVYEADHSLVDNSGRSALDYAKQSGESDVLEMLESKD